MDPESVINLFNSCWFNLEILKNHSNSSNSKPNPEPQIQETPKPMISIPKFPSIHMRSKSEEISSMASLYSVSPLSPSSVLFTPEHDEELDQERNKIRGVSVNRAKIGMSKSLSELEFEELKGFMDLGFVFSEEDRDSSLVEIIPGLQRLGKKKEEGQGDFNEVLVSRPYLSEAWEVVEERKERERPPLMINWIALDVNNEVDMKDSLKWWAHTVASAVR
ncbi:hypothetical protein LguiA_014804 [Lonicera macranthoides]